jgi:hypothetical protein
MKVYFAIEILRTYMSMLKKKLEKLNNHVTVSITILQSVSKRTYVYQDSCEIVQFYNFIVSN